MSGSPNLNTPRKTEMTSDCLSLLGPKGRPQPLNLSKLTPPSPQYCTGCWFVQSGAYELHLLPAVCPCLYISSHVLNGRAMGSEGEGQGGGHRVLGVEIPKNDVKYRSVHVRHILRGPGYSDRGGDRSIAKEHVYLRVP